MARTTYVDDTTPLSATNMNAMVQAEDLNTNDFTVNGGTKAVTMTKIVTGTYTGDGNASQTVNIGFTPIAVFVYPQSFVQSYPNETIGFAITSYDQKTYQAATNLVIAANGFTVYESGSGAGYPRTNANAAVYKYLALKG